MAKRRRSNVAQAVPMSSGGHSEVSSRIESAENGFIVRVSSETQGKKPEYHSRTFIATSHPHALRIAGQALRGVGQKIAKKKASRGKRFTTKK